MIGPPWLRLGTDGWAGTEASAARIVADARGRAITWELAPEAAEWEEPGEGAAERGGRASVPRAQRRAVRSGPCKRYGFDEQGQIVVAESLDDPGAEHPWWITVIDREQGSELLHLDFSSRSGRPLVLERVRVETIEGGRSIRARTWYRAWHEVDAEARGNKSAVESTTEFAYADGRMVGVTTDLTRVEGATERFRERLTYNATGHVHRVVRVDVDEADGEVGTPVTTYVRRSPARTRKARALLIAEIPACIERWARRSAPADSVWALVISYPSENPAVGMTLLPCLALATGTELSEWRGQRAPLEVAFNPAEYGIFDSEPAELFERADLAEASDLLLQEWEANDDDEAIRELYLDVVNALRSRDWSWLAAGGRDTIIFAVDDDLGDLERNLREWAERDVIAWFDT